MTERGNIDSLLHDPYSTVISNRSRSLSAGELDNVSIKPRSTRLKSLASTSHHDHLGDRVGDMDLETQLQQLQQQLQLQQPQQQQTRSSDSFINDVSSNHAHLPLSESFMDGASIASSEMKNAAWEKLVHRLFKSVPDNEPLYFEHNCAYQGEHILHQGKMYLTPNFICFHANIFGYLTTFEFPIQDILLIERAKTAFIIPNAIVLSTSSKSYFFTSFINRETAFMNMEYLITRYRESHIQQRTKRVIGHRRKTSQDETAALGATLGESTMDSLDARRYDNESKYLGYEGDEVDDEYEDLAMDTKIQYQMGAAEYRHDSRFRDRRVFVLTTMMLAIAVCMLLALGSTAVLFKIRLVIGRLETLSLSL